MSDPGAHAGAAADKKGSLAAGPVKTSAPRWTTATGPELSAQPTLLTVGKTETGPSTNVAP